MSSTSVSQDGSIEIRTLAAAAFEQPVVKSAGATITIQNGILTVTGNVVVVGVIIGGFGG